MPNVLKDLFRKLVRINHCTLRPIIVNYIGTSVARAYREYNLHLWPPRPRTSTSRTFFLLLFEPRKQCFSLNSIRRNFDWMASGHYVNLAVVFFVRSCSARCGLCAWINRVRTRLKQFKLEGLEKCCSFVAWPFRKRLEAINNLIEFYTILSVDRYIQNHNITTIIWSYPNQV